MASEKLNSLIKEFASDGIISPNELALLREKASEEAISEVILQHLITQELSNLQEETNNESGFLMPSSNDATENSNSSLEAIQSGFIQLDVKDSEDENNSGFVTSHEKKETIDIEKSMFVEQTDFFKNEQLLPNQGSMSQISLGIRHIRKVIIKRLKPEEKSNQKYIELLYKEFQNALAFEHPNIVRVYDSGQDKKGPYYYMEYIDGRPLSTLIQKGGIANHNLVKKIALEILSALSYVHKKQVFHRDLKPDNILLTYKGDNTKILDFGLALTDDFEDNMLSVGTPKYAAPEQSDVNFKVDGRSDLYSFGLIFTEMLVGSSTDINKLEQISTKLKAIVQKCTQELAHNRYFTASELSLEIQNLQIIKNKFSEVKIKKELPQKQESEPLKKTINKKPKETIKTQNYRKGQVATKKTKAKKKTSIGTWFLMILFLASAFFIGSELGYWNQEKKEIYAIEHKVMYISANKLRLRSSKSLKIKNVIGLYHKGTKLEVLEMSDEWAKVKINGKEGFMAFPKKYLSEDY